MECNVVRDDRSEESMQIGSEKMIIPGNSLKLCNILDIDQNSADKWKLLSLNELKRIKKEVNNLCKLLIKW